MIKKRDAIRVATSLLGTPYKELECGGDGANCLGIICLFFQRLGFDVPFPDSDDPAQVLSHDLSSYFSQVPSPRTGDVVRMSLGRSTEHLGIFIEGKVLQSVKTAGVSMLPMDRIKPSGFYRISDQ